MIKKFLVILSVLLIAAPAFALSGTSADSLTVAELMALPQGRKISVSNHTALSIWYDGPNVASVGVSGNNSIYFFEGGTAVSTIPQLNTGGLLVGDAAGVSVASADTVGEIVDLINLDTNGRWKAMYGPDATKGTAVHIAGLFIPANQAAPGTSRDEPTEVLWDTATADFLSCGVSNKDGAYNRIGRINASAEADINTGYIEVWCDSKQVFMQPYYFGANHSQPTPVIVEFDGFGGDGIGGRWSESLVAFIIPVGLANDITSTVQDEATGSMSVIYNVFE